MKAIYCAGEQGRVTLDILRRVEPDAEIVFLDDDPKRWGDEIHDTEVIGGQEALLEFDRDDVQVVIGYGAGQKVRLEIGSRIQQAGFELFCVVDPRTSISPSASIGRGSIVNAQSYVGPNVSMAELVLVDSAVNISHDVNISRGVTIGPNATLAGGTEVGEDAFIGAGATVVDHVSIGEGVTVGAGGVVVKSVEPHTTVVGVPAERI